MGSRLIGFSRNSQEVAFYLNPSSERNKSVSVVMFPAGQAEIIETRLPRRSRIWCLPALQTFVAGTDNSSRPPSWLETLAVFTSARWWGIVLLYHEYLAILARSRDYSSFKVLLWTATEGKKREDHALLSRGQVPLDEGFLTVWRTRENIRILEAETRISFKAYDLCSTICKVEKGRT